MRCTAPVRGHRTAAAAAACPACSSRSSYRSSYYPPASRPSYGGAGYSGGRGGSRSARSTKSGRVTGLLYTDAEWRTLKPVFDEAERQAERNPERRDVFLCHAWDDREGAAKDLHDLLVSRDVSVWFSEKDVALGASLMREIDKGLAMSRIGVVLATPAFLRRLDAGGVADKELSALLATDRLIPVAHETTFEALRDVSPLLAARSGLTSDGSLGTIAARLADAVAL